MRVTIAMRSHNDMPIVLETLAGLQTQTVPFTLLSLENASTDGTREAMETVADRLEHVPAGQYVPGRVINQAMALAQSEIVVFLNADCVPVDKDWLATLLIPFAEPAVAAAFSRQLPRTDCHPLAAQDTESAYGDGSNQAAWRNCFSMASCAIRRSVWEQIPFDEQITYSEDIAWSWQVRNAGHGIRYVPESKVFHSHNYTPAQWRRRQYGEGKAEASIFPWSPWQRSLVRYSLLPLARQIVRDVRYCTLQGQWSGLLQSPGYRMAQMLGRRRGLLDGLKEKA